MLSGSIAAAQTTVAASGSIVALRRLSERLQNSVANREFRSHPRKLSFLRGVGLGADQKLMGQGNVNSSGRLTGYPAEAGLRTEWPIEASKHDVKRAEHWRRKGRL